MICKTCGGEFDRENFDLCPYCLEPVVEDMDIATSSNEEVVIEEMESLNARDRETVNKDILAYAEINNSELDVVEEVTSLCEESESVSNEGHDCSIDIITQFSNRCKNVLHRNNIFTVGELLDFLETGRIEDFRNVGAKTLEEIRSFVKMYKEGIYVIPDVEGNLSSEGQDCSIETITSFSTRCKNVLYRNNIFTIGELLAFLETGRIEDLKNAGAKTLEEIYAFVKMYKEGAFIIPDIEAGKDVLVDKKFFLNMDESNFLLPVSSLGELGLTSKIVKHLNANGFTKCEQLIQITDGEILRIFGKKSLDAFQLVAKLLEKNIFDLYSYWLATSVQEKEGRIFLRRASGETLQEVADNPGIDGEAKLTRERIRQIESKYFRRNRGFVRTIVERLKGDKKYFLLQDIVELYENVDFDRVIIYVCKLLDEYEFLDFAGVFIETDGDEKVEDYILQLAREFVGEGIDLYENLEELEELFYANNLDYMSLGEFINLLQKYNYRFYKDYVVKGKVSYGLLCMNIIRKYFPKGIKLSQSVGEHGEDLECLRKLVIEKYGDVSIPDSDRSLSSTLIRFGLILCDRGRYITPENIQIDEFVLQNIKQYIDEKEEEIVYYTEIFAEFEGLLSMTSSVNNYNYLHGVLMLYYPEDYDYTRDYLVKKTGVNGSGETLAERIYAYLLEVGRPVHKNEIRRHFAGMSDVMLFMPMIYDKRMIQWDYNYYTVMDLIDISDKDKQELEIILKGILAENKGYSSGDMLFYEVCKQMPEFVSKNSLKSDTNLYYIASRLFEEICDFRRPHIGEKGKFEKFTTVDIAMHLLEYPETLLYSEFVTVAEKMRWSPVTAGVVFSEIETGYIRVSLDEYVEKNRFVIEEDAIKRIRDIVLQSMTNDILPLQNCIDYDEYPEVGYKWNEFLLGSILETYREEIQII